MPILIYPVLLESKRARIGPEPTPRQKMEALAKASGGKTFDADAGDLAQAAAQVGEELHSVYTVAYHPRNQSFDGKWREIQVRIKRPGVAFRTRPGYYAR
jgi:Ca-activated chloride channel family protein